MPDTHRRLIKQPSYPSVMGFDFGTRNIGSAVGQAMTRTWPAGLESLATASWPAVNGHGIPADERLTSLEAKQWAGRLDHRSHYGNKPIDPMAAQLLASWINGEGFVLLADC